MALVDPNTGRELKAPMDERLSQIETVLQQLISYVNGLAGQLTSLQQSNMHMNLFIEYFQQKALSLERDELLAREPSTDEEGNILPVPLLPLEMEQFPAWAKARIDEVRQNVLDNENASDEAEASEPEATDSSTVIDLEEE